MFSGLAIIFLLYLLKSDISDVCFSCMCFQLKEHERNTKSVDQLWSQINEGINWAFKQIPSMTSKSAFNIWIYRI